MSLPALGLLVTQNPAAQAARLWRPTRTCGWTRTPGGGHPSHESGWTQMGLPGLCMMTRLLEDDHDALTHADHDPMIMMIMIVSDTRDLILPGQYCVRVGRPGPGMSRLQRWSLSRCQDRFKLPCRCHTLSSSNSKVPGRNLNNLNLNHAIR